MASSTNMELDDELSDRLRVICSPPPNEQHQQQQQELEEEFGPSLPKRSRQQNRSNDNQQATAKDKEDDIRPSRHFGQHHQQQKPKRHFRASIFDGPQDDDDEIPQPPNAGQRRSKVIIPIFDLNESDNEDQEELEGEEDDDIVRPSRHFGQPQRKPPRTPKPGFRPYGTIDGNEDDEQENQPLKKQSRKRARTPAATVSSNRRGRTPTRENGDPDYSPSNERRQSKTQSIRGSSNQCNAQGRGGRAGGGGRGGRSRTPIHIATCDLSCPCRSSSIAPSRARSRSRAPSQARARSRTPAPSKSRARSRTRSPVDRGRSRARTPSKAAPSSRARTPSSRSKTPSRARTPSKPASSSRARTRSREPSTSFYKSPSPSESPTFTEDAAESMTEYKPPEIYRGKIQIRAGLPAMLKRMCEDLEAAKCPVFPNIFCHQEIIDHEYGINEIAELIEGLDETPDIVDDDDDE